MTSEHKYTQNCGLCDFKTNHIRRHVLKVHVPWYLDPSTACVDCQKSEGYGGQLLRFHRRHQLFGGELMMQAWFLLMNGVFLFIGRELGLGGSLPDLLEFVVTHQLLPTSLDCSEEEYHYFREFDQRSGLEPLTASGYRSLPPTRPVVISNHLIMTRILSRLSEAAQIAFESVMWYVMPDGSTPLIGYPTLTIGIIDSHCHIDSISGSKDRKHKKRRNITLLATLENSVTYKPSRLIYAISNYCYPSKWSMIDDQVRDESRLKYTVGVHPNLINRLSISSQFQQLVRQINNHPDAVGIGEIGLDMTWTCGCNRSHNMAQCQMAQLEAQRQFLRMALQLAKQVGKVIVLHIRDKGNDKAAKEVLYLLLELGLSDARIHRHCFIGGEEEYREWSSALPNCYFSVSSKSLQDSRTVSWLRLLEQRNRIIVETDAPYLSDDPWCVYGVAEETARYIGVSTRELVRACNKNVARLYSLPW